MTVKHSLSRERAHGINGISKTIYYYYYYTDADNDDADNNNDDKSKKPKAYFLSIQVCIMRTRNTILPCSVPHRPYYLYSNKNTLVENGFNAIWL